MAPRGQQTFKGLEGHNRIIQDGLAMLRSIYVGSLVADRDAYRTSRLGMKESDYHRIEDPTEREAYKAICNKLRQTLRTETSQEANTLNFFTGLGFDDPRSLTAADIPLIQEKLEEHYRIVFVNYHRSTQLCYLTYSGDVVRAKVIYIVSDGSKWDALSSSHGIYKKFLCAGCLQPSRSYHRHSCEYTCTSCNSLLVEGNCNDGGEEIICEDCNFKFKSRKCFEAHNYVDNRSRGGSRCSNVKLCVGCNSVYRTAAGPHVCGQSIYCEMCREYQSNQHECSWEKISETDRLRMQKKQDKFRWAYYDVETTQCTERADVAFDYGEHYVTTVVLMKVCAKCKDESVDDWCDDCGTRKAIFQYNQPTDHVYDVVDRFVNYLITEPTMKGREIYAHNGGRFDQHLILTGFHRLGIIPKTVDQGTTLIRVEVKLRDRKLVFKDTFRMIPMALSSFKSSFRLECEDKGYFPHLANMRCNWGRVWPSLPDKRYYGYKFMKPEGQIKFDEWYAQQAGKSFIQDEEILHYCEQDVLLLMMGCLHYRETMKNVTGWCPFTTANTLAAFCLFQLRADHLNDIDMPYLPEYGFGSVNQSASALKYIKFKEKQLGYELQHANSPLGEKKVKIGRHNFSIDCYDPVLNKIMEYMGCWFHGCRRCYAAGTKLVGGERADELYDRTMRRIEILRTKFPNIEIVWECQVKEELKENKDGIRDFFDEVEVVERLRMRDALYGGRVEVIRSFLRSTEDTVVKYYDIVSLYPAIQSTREFPIGHPQVITSGFKEVVGESFPYRGIAKIRILPPRSLKLGALPHRFDGNLIFGLCAACVKEKKESCDHEDEMARSWTGTYATMEIELALRKGYKVMKIHEVYHWDIWDGTIYRNYFKRFMKLKFASSKWPPGVRTPEQQAAYCARVGHKLGFELVPSEVKEDPALRLVCKLCNNSGWGKLAEVPPPAQARVHQG